MNQELVDRDFADVPSQEHMPSKQAAADTVPASHAPLPPLDQTALLLDIGIAPQDRSFVEIDVDDPGVAHGAPLLSEPERECKVGRSGRVALGDFPGNRTG